MLPFLAWQAGLNFRKKDDWPLSPPPSLCDTQGSWMWREEPGSLCQSAWGCYNKIPETGKAKITKLADLAFGEGSPLDTASASSQGGKEGALAIQPLTPHEDPSPITPSRSNSLPEAPRPQTITLGFRASTSRFGRVQRGTRTFSRWQFVVLTLDSCVTLGELPNASDFVSSSV